MRSYVIFRSIGILPLFLTLVTVIFIVLRVMPGDPVYAIGHGIAPPAFYDEMRKDLGLDKPIYIQYFEYINGIFQGNLGYSYYNQRPVIGIIIEAFPVTLELTIFAMIIAILLGIIEGTISALNRDRIIDNILRMLSIVKFALPVFVTGLIFQLLFNTVLPTYGRLNPLVGIKRITGMYTLDAVLTGNPIAFIDSLAHLILPSLTLGIFVSATIARISRVQIIEVLSQDFIVVLKAKGISKFDFIIKHLLPNAFIPLITVTGLQFTMLLGGAVLTETVFGLPGMGRLLVDSIEKRDLPLVQGLMVMYAIVTGIITLIVDITYGLIDPRIGHK